MTKDTQDWNGHDEEVQEKMDQVTEGAPQEAYDELYDILMDNYKRYYAALHEDSPLKSYLDYATRDDLTKIKDINPCPVVYANTLIGVECSDGSVIPANVAVRLTMASGIGDVGVTTNLGADSGYSARVSLVSLQQYRTTMHFDEKNPEPHFSEEDL